MHFVFHQNLKPPSINSNTKKLGATGPQDSPRYMKSCDEDSKIVLEADRAAKSLASALTIGLRQNSIFVPTPNETLKVPTKDLALSPTGPRADETLHIQHHLIRQLNVNDRNSPTTNGSKNLEPNLQTS